MKTCKTCKESKEGSFFYAVTTRKNGKTYKNLRKECKVCSRANRKNHVDNNRERIVEEQKRDQKKYYASGKPAARKYELRKTFIEALGGCCSKCGYDRCLACLELHHRDPSEKEFSISGGVITKKSWDRCMKEAEKCELLCNRCHREVHHLGNEVSYGLLLG